MKVEPSFVFVSALSVAMFVVVDLHLLFDLVLSEASLLYFTRKVLQSLEKGTYGQVHLLCCRNILIKYGPNPYFHTNTLVVKHWVNAIVFLLNHSPRSMSESENRPDQRCDLILRAALDRFSCIFSQQVTNQT